MPLLAAASLLFVALGNPSLAGSAFLIPYLLWAVICVPLGHSPHGLAISQAIFGTAAATSGIAFSLQIGVQAAYFLKAPGIQHHIISRIMEILGFSRVKGWMDVGFEVVPLALAMVFTGNEAARLTRARMQQRQQVSVGGVEEEEEHEEEGENEFNTGAGATTTVIVMTTLVGSSLPIPALLSTPYVIALCFTLYGAWHTSSPSSSLWLVKLLQVYAAAHLIALYAWQWALFYASPLQNIATTLGLFLVDWRSQGVGEAGCGAVVIASLALLVPGLGYYYYYCNNSSTARTMSPLHRQYQQQIASFISCLFSTSFSVIVVMSMVSLLRPSVFGACLTCLATVYLAIFPNPASSKMTYATAVLSFWSVLLWLLVCFVCTALDIDWPLGEAIGAHNFTTTLIGSYHGAAAMLPLLSMLALLSAVSLHLRHHHYYHHHPPSNASNQHYWPGHHVLVQSMAACATTLLPFGIFIVGVLVYDILHTTVIVACVMSLSTLPLSFCRPMFSTLNTPRQFHIRLLRIYAGIVVLSLYVVCVGSLESFHGVLQPHQYRHVLTVLGLWHPDAWHTIFPFSALLIASAACFSLRQWATLPSGFDIDSDNSTSIQQQPPVVRRVPTWRPPWLIITSRFGATYGCTIISIFVLYITVLLGMDNVCLVGALYLTLAVWCIAQQPTKSHWMEQHGNVHRLYRVVLGSSSSMPGNATTTTTTSTFHVVLVDSSRAGWLPLQCAIGVATIDFFAQLLIPLLHRLQITSFSIPFDFIQSAIGISTETATTTALLRPLLILMAIVVYNYLYCLGTLHRQLENASMDDATYERVRYTREFQWKAFVKRFLILHACKAVVVLAFAAAMQIPSAMGWILVMGIVIIPPSVGPGAPSSSPLVRNPCPIRNPLVLDASLLAVQCIASVWLIAQYVVQNTWLVDCALSSQYIVSVLVWIGIVPGGGSAGPFPLSLESLLRYKACVVVAVAVNSKAMRWWARLPPAVRNEAKCGAACPLFWPPSPDPAFLVDGDSSGDSDRALGGDESPNSQGRVVLRDSPSPEPDTSMTLSNTFQNISLRARTLAQQALQAVDWPSPRVAGSDGGTDSDRDGGTDGGDDKRTEQEAQNSNNDNDTHRLHAVAEEEEESSSESLPPQQEQQYQNNNIKFFIQQQWIEELYDNWGLEISMFTLLFTAFLSSNALSLLYLFAVALGMVLPYGPRRTVWSWIVVPLLANILGWQYSQILGLPPPSPSPTHTTNISSTSTLVTMSSDLREWLGLDNINPLSLWSLFFAFGAAVLQVYCDRLRRFLESGTSDGTAPPPDLRAPLLDRLSHRSLPTTATVQQTTSATVWAPLTREAQQRQWRWHDRMRYVIYRKSLDFLLIAVVALCTMDNDIIHAGYLALALFFFRSRISLRSKRNSLFVWLPLYNFAVMATVIAYQAPFEDIWDLPLDDGTSCTLAHVLGLYKLRGSGSSSSSSSRLLSWGYEGAIADLILWVFIRIQTHMFASPTYVGVVAVAEEEEEEERAARKKEVMEWKLEQAAGAVEESRQRAARALRISRIKQGVDKSLNRVGGGVHPTMLDFAFLDVVSTTTGNELHGGDGGGDTNQQTREEFGGGVTTRRRRDTANEQDEEERPQQHPSASLLTEYEKQLFKASEADLLREDHRHDDDHNDDHHDHHHHTQPSTSPGTIPSMLRSLLPKRTDRRESALAYALFIFAYLSDLSLLTMVLPISACVYALVAVRPSRAYWNVVLVYCEAIIVLSYAFQVPSRLACAFISPVVQRTAEMLGIHANAVRIIPLFLVYLATLRHTHGLLTRHQAGKRRIQREVEAQHSVNASPTKGQPPPRGSSSSSTRRLVNGKVEDLEIGYTEEQEQVEGLEEEDQQQILQSQQQHPEDITPYYSFVLSSITARIISSTASVFEFLLTALTPSSERPPSFLLVHYSSTVDMDGASLQRILQEMIDTQRHDALVCEQVYRHRSSASLLHATGEEQGGDDASGVSRDFWHGASSSVVHEDMHRHRPYAANAPSSPSLVSVGPLQLRFHAFIDETVLQVSSLPSQDMRGKKVYAARDDNHPDQLLQYALFEVISLQSTPENTPGICSIPGWPLRCLSPASLAATALPTATKTKTTNSAIQLLNVEPHGRQARDFYAVTAVLDILGFMLVALYYNKVMHGAGSLSEITSLHVVPLGYLITLIILFMFVVLDRVVYSLGSCLGKGVLHVVQMIVFFWYCSSLVWNDPFSSSSYSGHAHGTATTSDGSGDNRGSTTTKSHDLLRILLFIKLLSFALSALQLRTGYPPPASYANGMGRHTFVFMRSVSVPASLAFHVFTAVPFLYEMRQLLDWACTATTLTLYDWLKLEDINQSLYFAAVMRAARAGRRPGTRQPRYLKFFQGTLLFVGLLVLLWVPLLVFSTGNPTYRVPAVSSFAVNVTLQASSSSSTGATGGGGRIVSPLYRAGDRGVWRPWIDANRTSAMKKNSPPQQLPYVLSLDYTPDQLQLLCTPPDSDSLWTSSPPARQAMIDALSPSSSPSSSSADAEDSDSASTVVVVFGWHVLRDLPPPSDHGGPGCSGSVEVPLDDETRAGLLEILTTTMSPTTTTPPEPIPLVVPLKRYVDTDDDDAATTALFPAFWVLRGDACWARPLMDGDVRGSGDALPGRRRPLPDMSWSDQWIACNISLPSSGGGSGSGEWWWRLACYVVDSNGDSLEPQQQEEEDDNWSIVCPSPSTNTGPRIVGIVDKVQAGIIGATLTKFGVIGLYTVFVYGIGRFLRLSITNLRMRIPYEDLPTTRRLVALCQDIYIARAEGLLGLEEELYGALLDIYRLPSVMYELTKKRL